MFRERAEFHIINQNEIYLTDETRQFHKVAESLYLAGDIFSIPGVPKKATRLFENNRKTN